MIPSGRLVLLFCAPTLLALTSIFDRSLLWPMLALDAVIDDVSARTLVRLLHALSQRHLPICVLFRDRDIERLVEPSGGPTGRGEIELCTRGAAAEALLWRDRLSAEMKTKGAMVLDTFPEQLTPHLLSRYLDIKARKLL